MTELNEEICSTVRGIVVRLCHRHPKLLEHVDDAYQAALVKAWGCLRRYDPLKNDSFWGFATISIRGAAIDYFRRQSLMCRGDRTKPQTISLSEEHSAILEDPSPVAPILMNRVVYELKRLPPNWRYVLERRCEGYYLHEIGSDLGVTEGRVGQIERQAIDRLRVRLAITGRSA